jgi:hypothetical protein
VVFEHALSLSLLDHCDFLWCFKCQQQKKMKIEQSQICKRVCDCFAFRELLSDPLPQFVPFRLIRAGTCVFLRYFPL